MSHLKENDNLMNICLTGRFLLKIDSNRMDDELNDQMEIYIK